MENNYEIIEREAASSMRMLVWYIIPASIISLALLFILLFVPIAHAEIDSCTAVKCIMGEARGEPYKGKVAIASALRNRGTIKGVYGCKATFSEPEWVWEQARRAWLESAIKDVVNGASFWGSIKVDKKWIARMAKTMIKTVKVGNHVFYREGK